MEKEKANGGKEKKKRLMDGKGEKNADRWRKKRPGWQKQWHTWHIVPRDYSSKPQMSDLKI